MKQNKEIGGGGTDFCFPAFLLLLFCDEDRGTELPTSRTPYSQFPVISWWLTSLCPLTIAKYYGMFQAIIFHKFFPVATTLKIPHYGPPTLQTSHPCFSKVSASLFGPIVLLNCHMACQRLKVCTHKVNSPCCLQVTCIFSHRGTGCRD